MGYYDNIYAATYKFYSRFKREEPRSSAICVVAVCQMMLCILIFAIFQRIGMINLREIGINKFYFLPLIFVWLFLLFKYYSEEKGRRIIEVFELKTSAQKKIWGVTSLVSFLLPIILIAVFTMK